jgi:hypothetical protein
MSTAVDLVERFVQTPFPVAHRFAAPTQPTLHAIARLDTLHPPRHTLLEVSENQEGETLCPL